MIPKVVHYCWFGTGKQSDAVKQALESWKNIIPDFTIRLWNEHSFDVNSHEYTKRMYRAGHYAFVADYVRLKVLEEHGGICLDADMILVQPLTVFLQHECFLGEEAPGTISAGAFGAIPHHPFIQKCLSYYDTHTKDRETIPRILTSTYNSFGDTSRITVYPPKTFYPFDSNNIHLYKGQSLSNDVYGVHLWDYSWGHPLNKFFKKIGVYRIGKRVTEILGIKKLLKKLLGFV